MHIHVLTRGHTYKGQKEQSEELGKQEEEACKSITGVLSRKLKGQQETKSAAGNRKLVLTSRDLDQGSEEPFANAWSSSFINRRSPWFGHPGFGLGPDKKFVSYWLV